MDSEPSKRNGTWKFTLYFDTEAAFKVTDKYDNIKGEDLMTKYKSLVGVDEDILRVNVYEVPLYKWQITKPLLFHMFVVFETQNWWWSIDKDSNGITLQRSKRSDAALYTIRQKRRLPGVQMMLRDEGNMSMHTLLYRLYLAGELKKEYDNNDRNCKHFATSVFNKVAKNKEIVSVHYTAFKR
ncbi:hypothetical protein DPMN_064421 [Dreissena polymorpha]|uniref:Uncharacterized protein n=1 Tax=Dreissena polymorpha TaxID=45954 RepID=A0A9D4CC78_DREPO|nr:hypothetical protein DPMN_064421 [Dreissena polymorpha]